MAKLAIKGHPTRGKEVVRLLEMLGGEDCHNLYGKKNFSYYTIENDEIKGGIYIFGDEPYKFFTLEEFEEKFPYKVGERVTHNCNTLLETQVITNIRWDSDDECVIYYLDNCDIIKVEDILYRIDFCEDNISTIQGKGNISDDYHPSNKEVNYCQVIGNDTSSIGENTSASLINEETMEGVYAYNEINCYHQDFGDKVRIRLGNDFEIKVEDKITYIVKKQPQYPKDYEECCDVLNIPNDERYIDIDVPLTYNKLLSAFTKLIICRKAYWKLAGDEMGLDKPWKPDWSISGDIKYVIEVYRNNVRTNSQGYSNTILAFPTPEMRNAFYENFKDLIENCKELL